MAIDVSEHPLLTETSFASAEALAAHSRVAEQVLGLAGLTLTGADLSAAQDAVALQVNFQVDVLPDRDWGTIQQENPFTYIKENAGVNPVALRIAQAIRSRKQAAAAFASTMSRARYVTSVNKDEVL